MSKFASKTGASASASNAQATGNPSDAPSHMGAGDQNRMGDRMDAHSGNHPAAHMGGGSMQGEMPDQYSDRGIVLVPLT
jgi:hypothetical protein